MNRIILSLSLAFVTIFFLSCKGTNEKDSTSQEQGYSSQEDNSSIVGIWQSTEDDRYFFIYKSTGEYEKVKIGKGWGKKGFGTYTVSENTLVITYQDREPVTLRYFLDNGNTLIIYDDSHREVYRRVSQQEFDSIANTVKDWDYYGSSNKEQAEKESLAEAQQAPV